MRSKVLLRVSVPPKKGDSDGDDGDGSDSDDDGDGDGNTDDGGDGDGDGSDGDGGDDADGDGDKTKSARSVLCRQRLLVRHLPVYHGCKFKEKAFPCLIQTGEGFSLNLHLAKSLLSRPTFTASQRGAAW